MHANSVQSANPEPIQSQSRHRFGLAGPKPILYFPCQSMRMQRPIRSQCWLKGLGYEGHTDANRLPILSQSGANQVPIRCQSGANQVPIPSEWKANLEPILSQPGKPMSNQSKANQRPIEGQSGANRVPLWSRVGNGLDWSPVHSEHKIPSSQSPLDANWTYPIQGHSSAQYRNNLILFCQFKPIQY